MRNLVIVGEHFDRFFEVRQGSTIRFCIHWPGGPVDF